jgi:hypothetical protein
MPPPAIPHRVILGPKYGLLILLAYQKLTKLEVEEYVAVFLGSRKK